jgi:hypothetical protein
MIHEYAIEPNALVQWASNRLACGYIKDNFSEGRPRIISQFPKKWAKQCLESQALDDNARKNLLELIYYLKEHAIRRADSSYNPENTWLENIQHENRRHPFAAILATSSLRDMENVLLSDEIENWRDSQLWQIEQEKVVERTTRSMTAAVAPLLQKADEIHFIDPHFSASRGRFIQPLAAMLETAVKCSAFNPKKCFYYHVSDKWDLDVFMRDCQRELPAIIPSGLKVQFKRWKRRPGGEKLHNRYILTNLGGVSFGIGLDAGEAGETDDIVLLGRELRTKRWQQYVSNNGDFVLENEFCVSGEMP